MRLLQVLDVHVWLGRADCRTAPGIVLRTGAVTLHSSKSLPPTQPGHHALSAAEAAAHLSACIKQRRLAARLGAGAGAAAAEALRSARPSGAVLDAAAAVAAVEQHLLYQQFDFSVEELQVSAVNLDLEAASPWGHGGDAASSSTSCSSSSSFDGSDSSGGDTVRAGSTLALLQPLRLAGLLKLHRIALVSALPAFKQSGGAWGEGGEGEGGEG